jgi:hypothetical protein
MRDGEWSRSQKYESKNSILELELQLPTRTYSFVHLRLGADFVAAAGICRSLRLVEVEAARLMAKSISVKMQNIYQ